MGPQNIRIGVSGHVRSKLEAAPSGELFMLSLADFFAGSGFGSAFVAAKAPIE